MPDTHEVLNQPPLLGDVDLFATDAVLRAGVEREGAGWAAAQLGAVGRCAGGDAMEWGRLANVHTPVLRTHDRFGRRIDEVEFHPAWHHLMGASVGFGLHGSPWAGGVAGRRPPPGRLHRT